MNTQKLAQESHNLVKLIQSGQLNRKQIIHEMAEMDKKYPAIGWAIEANKLQAYWVRLDQIKPFQFIGG